MGSETILPMITAVVLGGTLITGEKEALSVLYWRVFSLTHAVWLANDGFNK